MGLPFMKQRSALFTYMIRDKQFNLRMTEAELQRLKKVSEHYSLSACATIRMLVKLEADRLERKGKR